MKTRTFFKKSKFLQTFLLLITFGLLFSNSISLFSQSQKQLQGRATIVFIDKTMSAEPDSFIIEKNNSWLKRIIKENAIELGDKIILSFIYENTSSSTNKFEFAYRPPKLQEVRMSSSEARIAKVKYNKLLRAYKKSFTTKIHAQAFSHEANRTSTDVVGSIKLLSDISSQYNGYTLKAYFFSDMQECSPFRYLYCGSSKSKLSSFEQAQSLANLDVKRLLKRYQLSDTCLKNISEITIIFPAKEMDANKAFTILPMYWDYIFKHFGVKQQINYH